MEEGQYGRVGYGVHKAVAILKKESGTHVHGDRCLRLIKHLLAPDEETLIECRQSYLNNLAPARVIATTRRILVVKPSFWGLYVHHDILAPTEYNIIPYKNLISVIMTKGRILSTIHMRIHGFTESTGTTNEGEVYGMRTKEAVRLANFLEEIIEYRDEENEQAGYHVMWRAEEEKEYAAIKRISIDELRQIVNDGKAKVAWLGVEPVDYVSTILKIDKDKIIRTGINTISKESEDEIAKLKDCILVCYQGSMALHFALFLKKAHGMECSVLNNGIMSAAHSYFSHTHGEQNAS